MPGYLLLVELIAFTALSSQGARDKLYRDVLIVQSLLLVIFYLVWGGYSIDSWSYLTGFDGSPLVYEKEWLFYSIGFVLNKLVNDPWPLRIISASCVALTIAALMSFFGRHDPRSVVIALFLMPLLPAFFLSFGNTTRQGLAAAIIIFCMVRYLKGSVFWLLFAAVLAFLIHQPSVILIGAIALANIDRRWIVFCLAMAPVAGWLGTNLLMTAGIDINSYLPYATRNEGDYHIAKFLVGYSIAWLLLIYAGNDNDQKTRVLKAFAITVAVASLLVRFEVPFERILAYSEILLPFALPVVIQKMNLSGRWLQVFAIGGIGIGWLLWTHHSVVTTLGFA